MATLYEKVYACLAASRVASAMGAVVEGFSPEKIRDTYGFVDRFYPYEHFAERGIRWMREPGTTEDGIERQNLLSRAIIAKQDRISCEDFARTLLECLDPEKMVYTSMPDDLKALNYLRAGVPAVEIGHLCDRSGRNGLARAGQPIGLINAADPGGAVRDCFDVGRVWFAPRDSALVWGSVYVAAVAEALRPQATVELTVAAGISFAPDPVKQEIQRAVHIATRSSDWEAMRAEFYKIYSGIGTAGAFAMAAETVSKAFAVFVHSQGDVKKAILTAVNFGRDTDCLGAMAGGLAGALSGAATLPAEWVEQVDAATAVNPYTNTKWTVKRHADGFLSALQSRARKMRELASILEE